MKQQVRIIGGKFRGKKITFPSLEGLRPTPNRVRETLFNWLMNSIPGTRCLDAFAGSGALGFEAFSRGAREVVFIEQSTIAYHHLRLTAHKFNDTPHRDHMNPLQVIHTDTFHYLKTQVEPFDIIFLDPPFSQTNFALLIDLIQSNHILGLGGLLYLETPHPITVDSSYWTTLKTNQAGQVYYSLYQKRRLRTLDKATSSCFNQ